MPILLHSVTHIDQQLDNVERALRAGDVHQRLLVVVAVVDVDAEVEELGGGLGRPLLDGQCHGRVAVNVELDEQALLMGEFLVYLDASRIFCQGVQCFRFVTFL